VTRPASAGSIIPRLAGWMLSGIVSFAVILATWIPFGNSKTEAVIVLHASRCGIAARFLHD
jgi:hypothetical protein